MALKDKIQLLLSKLKGSAKLTFNFLVMVTIGTAGTIILKTMFCTESKNSNGEEQKFEVPMFSNLLMFTGMFLCLPIWFGGKLISYIKRKVNNQSEDEIQKFNLSQEDVSKNTQRELTFKDVLFILLPTLCDFGSSYLTTFGLLFVPSSIYQMMRGSVIVFSMIFAIFWRKQKQFVHHFIGVSLIILALVVVGASMFIPHGNTESSEEKEESREWYYVLIGIGLIISAQLLLSLDTVFEEIILKDINSPASLLVGIKGFYGILLCSVVLPAFKFMTFLPDSIREDIVDTFYMLINSWVLIVLSVLYIFFILIFNYCGTIIIQVSSAMMRNIMEPTRMVTVWIVSVIMYYAVGEEFGESLNYSTIVEVVGFVILVIGFLLYVEMIKIPCSQYQKGESEFVKISPPIELIDEESTSSSPSSASSPAKDETNTYEEMNQNTTTISDS